MQQDQMLGVQEAASVSVADVKAQRMAKQHGLQQADRHEATAQGQVQHIEACMELLSMNPPSTEKSTQDLEESQEQQSSLQQRLDAVRMGKSSCLFLSLPLCGAAVCVSFSLPALHSASACELCFHRYC